MTIDHQAVAGPRNTLDGKGVRGNLCGDTPGHCDGPIEAVLADDHASPALVVKTVPRDDLAICVGEQEEDLHDQRLDMNLAGRTFDETQGWAHPKWPERKVLAYRQIGKLQHGLPPKLFRVIGRS